MTVIVNLMTIFKVTEMNMFPLRFINYSFFICKFAEHFQLIIFTNSFYGIISRTI